MTEILCQKLIKLVRGDDGVALVVTLALFMFLYVSCAGVYTVGRAVKDRIILQNAVDAAAYSAAVVQADYLSRIATINKAMAWNYAQFLKSQRNWIALRFMEKLNERPWTKEFNSEFTVSDTKRLWNIDTDVRRNLPADLKLDEARAHIEQYVSELAEQSSAIYFLLTDSTDGMQAKIDATVKQVLMANLPFRLGELCRIQVKQPQPVGAANAIFAIMTPDQEDQFLNMIADDDGDVGSLITLKDFWFKINQSIAGFQRVIGANSLKTSLDWFTWDDPMERRQRLPVVDAHDFIPEIPAYGYVVQPYSLNGRYFYDLSRGASAEGAITVAVAKWNENPWKQLVRDLTGIHAAFDYGEQNDWTFAIASAQAGYRNNTGSTLQAYSVNLSGFDSVTLGKTGGGAVEYRGQDWDAMYVPVRTAFTPGEFDTWMRNGTAWSLLVPLGKREYVSEPLEQLRFYVLNQEALARMHNNNGAARYMQWNSDGEKTFLDLLYH